MVWTPPPPPLLVHVVAECHLMNVFFGCHLHNASKEDFWPFFFQISCIGSKVPFWQVFKFEIVKVKNQVQIENQKSRACDTWHVTFGINLDWGYKHDHVCTIGWNWLWQLTESSDNVRSRAVDRSTIQFLPVFWVLLTEACYYSKNLSSNQGVMNSFQYLQIINSNFLFSLSYFCMLHSTKYIKCTIPLVSLNSSQKCRWLWRLNFHYFYYMFVISKLNCTNIFKRGVQN